MKALTAIDIGRIVVVRFMDHSENMKGPALTEAIGRVTAVEPGQIRIRAWGPVDPTDTDETCTTHYSILPACVKRIRRLSK